jgi:hypothetical protein
LPRAAPHSGEGDALQPVEHVAEGCTTQRRRGCSSAMRRAAEPLPRRAASTEYPSAPCAGQTETTQSHHGEQGIASSVPPYSSPANLTAALHPTGKVVLGHDQNI